MPTAGSLGRGVILDRAPAFGRSARASRSEPLKFNVVRTLRRGTARAAALLWLADVLTRRLGRGGSSKC